MNLAIILYHAWIYKEAGGRSRREDKKIDERFLIYLILIVRYVYAKSMYVSSHSSCTIITGAPPCCTLSSAAVNT